jgi:uncharacterized protein
MTAPTAASTTAKARAKKPHFLMPLLARDPGALVLRNERNGRLLAHRIEGAFDSASRRRGLLGREGLADGVALIIAPCQAIHTFRMSFPIDVIFADRQGRVVHFRSNVGPRRLTGAWRAFAAIEMASGSAAHADIQIGDLLSIAR